jgi:3',5'-cyclic-AMP phosphodiesterase
MVSGSFSLLQITDLHLLAAENARLLGVDTAKSLDAVLRAALSERAADAMIVTGDIAHDAIETTYTRVGASIAAHYSGPVLWLPGNNDVAAPFDRQRPEPRELRLGAWQIIALDTHVDEMHGGNVADAELERLRSVLAGTPARFVIVAGHHPPAPLGTPWLDRDAISNGVALLELLSSDARVKAYVCGHVHQETATTHRGVRILTTPSTCFQFVPGTASFSVDATPPGWRWLDLASDGTLTTRVGRATDFPVTLDLSGFKKKTSA